MGGLRIDVAEPLGREQARKICDMVEDETDVAKWWHVVSHGLILPTGPIGRGHCGPEATRLRP